MAALEANQLTDVSFFYGMSSNQFRTFLYGTIGYRTNIDTSQQFLNVNFHATPFHAFWFTNYTQTTKGIKDCVDSNYYLMALQIDQEHFK